MKVNVVDLIVKFYAVAIRNIDHEFVFITNLPLGYFHLVLPVVRIDKRCNETRVIVRLLMKVDNIRCVY